MRRNQRLSFSKAEKSQGFTLIELLIVIGIIAILATGVIISINPGRQFSQARDTTRESHLSTLHKAFISYQISNQGNLNDLSLPTEPSEICNTNLDPEPDCSELDLIDLSVLVDEGHINGLPIDPQATGDGTGYEVAEGSIILVAPLAETRFIGIGMTETEYAGGGGEETFACGDTFTDDRDGQTYETVEIGTQCWMAENINVGDMVTVSEYQNDNEVIEKYCYNDNASNCDTYGGLYEWEEAMKYTTTEGAQGICPDGWYIPTDSEVSTLETWLTDNSYSGVEGDALKDPEPDWCSGSGTCGGSGFLALPGGYLGDMATFANLNLGGWWWTSTDSAGSYAQMLNINDDSSTITRDTNGTYKGHSIRCLKE